MEVSMDLYQDVCNQRTIHQAVTGGKTAVANRKKKAANKRMKWSDPW
jgi:hypothetical protein